MDTNVTPDWQTVGFDELNTRQLYEILKLRQEVFAVEQTSIYLDVDGLDQEAMHISLWEGDELLAYERCLPPGLQETESTIGRIVVAPAARGRNLGRELVRRGVEHNLARWPGHNIRMHAQAHLEKFYNAFEFYTEGEEYILDGIPHLEMVFKAPAGT
ncbi:GNAT family N-acetyltransferase [Halioglobus japonicus]|uniref:GNAT family N-acetyltransferase n=1 Tax=Halioglobus japonicus TaxID=930805 RepID=A0AAP8MCR9_9GAMM|nr:GNAT family N-acetyltransferase [Halioglobus japonicus]AQA17480.1 GNAT family N-acetyltransferase [Halioglobus japonicus]PLW85408.1 GNAT family N-acetyltransferase [Halioglobus japonicus]